VIFIAQDIILYSTGCPKCNVLKAKLQEKGITFTENNSVDEMMSMGLTEAPMLMVNGERMNFMSAVQWVGMQ
jgi:glutaredoxin